MATLCPYCGNATELVMGEAVLPRAPAAHGKPFHLCRPCDAFVGCEPNSTVPLGRPANAELRRLQSAAADAFMPIWQTGDKSRAGAHIWLAEKLGIPTSECHIRKFDAAMCLRTVTICNERVAKKAARRHQREVAGG